MSAPRVLIVDDEQPLARILSFALENEGYRVDVACDGIDAMNKVSTFSPDLILMDIMMPKLDGIETIRELRRKDKKLPIIAMSEPRNDVRLDYLNFAKQFGADAIIEKPLNAARLLDLLKNLMTPPCPA